MEIEQRSLEALEDWRSGLAREISELEKKLEQTKATLEMKREKFRALEVLIAPPVGTKEGSHLHAGVTHKSEMSGGELTSQEAFTHPALYWEPILESLVERGGSDRSDSILGMVEKKMENILTPADHGMLPSGISVRWRNRAQWQRQNMVQQGLMSSDSRHGIWEITDAGREWLNQAKKRRSDGDSDQ